MPSEDTLLGSEFRFQVGDGASPEVFTNMCAVVDPGAIGEESPLIDTTSLCDLARTYRRGLPDGAEIPLVANFIVGDEQLRGLYEDYQAKVVRNFRLTILDASPDEYIEFAAIIRGWNISVPVGDKSNITFQLKITGQVNWVYT